MKAGDTNKSRRSTWLKAAQKIQRYIMIITTWISGSKLNHSVSKIGASRLNDGVPNPIKGRNILFFLEKAVRNGFQTSHENNGLKFKTLNQIIKCI